MAKKIMIVDDDPAIVTYLETFFQDNGYETVTASNGSDAARIIKAEKPDLVTLDLDMPKEWGPRFYRKYTKDPDLKEIPVVVISGLSGNRYAIKNALATLSKPFDRDELLKIVKGAIG